MYGPTRRSTEFRGISVPLRRALQSRTKTSLWETSKHTRRASASSPTVGSACVAGSCRTSWATSRFRMLSSVAWDMSLDTAAAFGWQQYGATSRCPMLMVSVSSRFSGAMVKWLCNIGRIHEKRGASNPTATRTKVFRCDTASTFVGRVIATTNEMPVVECRVGEDLLSSCAHE
ncbi:hypothetical protein OUZ56_017477 [Daphnia magna]|uniref:Uncharacterized protein n=1 Tax=Daphnia magna TaxID=35525 RepID=A0ABR0ASW2_9CRUS|nr:hypothetical protein OUZ56_017477 [Daphnia magna]